MFRQVLLIDKSKMIREGLTQILLRRGLVGKVACAAYIDECPLVLRGNNPDLVIVGVDLWTESVDKLRQKHGFDPEVYVVGLVTQYCHKDHLLLFDDLLYMTDTEEGITSKLSSLHAQQHQQHTKEETASEKLTEREKEVLQLLIKGFSNKEVADKLSISPHTVITHRKNLIEKTGIRSLAGLAVFAILNNIADIEDIQH